MQRKFEQRPAAPVEHFCRCGKWGCWGLTYPAVVVAEWFCADCVPDDFWQRRAA